MTLPYAEPYKIKMTEAIRTSTRAEREAWIREARYNLFKLRSDQVTIDLLTDSGTGSMSDRQWAAMMTGDESYAGASSYFRLKETIESIFGMPYFLPTHQGRAAENVIFSALLKAGDIVPGNSHFDTTKGHIEFRRCHAVDCTIDDAADTQKELPFKGEMDIAKLEKLLRENPREKVPCVVLTITNNTAGGQPVSMRNIRETAEVCRRYGVPLLLDSARFAENAYFIKTREEGYADKTIKEIVREIYTYADIMTISAKKDGVVNMGGFVAMRSEELYRQAMTFSIMFEGYVTYGGMSGRDMDALAVGLDENTEYEQLDARIRQVKLLGDLLDEIPVDAARWFFVSKDVATHMDLDLKLARSKDNNNPVYYAQYAYSRMCSILKNPQIPEFKPVDSYDRLTDEKELQLLKMISEFPKEVAADALNRKPNKMTEYIISLVKVFHSYYNSCLLYTSPSPRDS